MVLTFGAGFGCLEPRQGNDMAQARRSRKTDGGKSKGKAARAGVWRGPWRVAACIVLPVLALVALVSVVNPPTDFYMASERARLGHLQHQWTPIAKISPAMARSVVAAEDANFCPHWGFDT